MVLIVVSFLCSLLPFHPPLPSLPIEELGLGDEDAQNTVEGKTNYFLILVIFVPCKPKPPISPF